MNYYLRDLASQHRDVVYRLLGEEYCRPEVTPQPEFPDLALTDEQAPTTEARDELSPGFCRQSIQPSVPRGTLSASSTAEWRMRREPFSVAIVLSRLPRCQVNQVQPGYQQGRVLLT